MLIMGCDLHSRYQQIALLDTGTGEVVTRRLEHENGEARAFYAGLPEAARVGIEATGYTQWLERMLAELGHELWIGDPAEIRARAVRRQKIAKVAIAQQLAVRLYWTLRQASRAASPVRTPSSPARTVVEATPSIL